MAAVDEDALGALVGAGARIALADGCGTPRAAFGALSRLAAARGDLRLVLGWMPAPVEGLELGAFADARTVMPGWGLRSAVDDGTVHAVPVRMSVTPTLLTGALRPDLLVAGVVEGDDGLHLGSDVSWVRAVIDAGVPVAAVVDEALPRAAAGPALPRERVTVIGRCADGPAEIPSGEPSDEHRAIAEHVARLVGGVGDGARLQWGPGALGLAVVAAVGDAGLRVRADSGLLGDAVVDLDERGLLVGPLDAPAVATYLVGTRRLYDWADGRAILHGIKHTHAPGRLAADPPLVAVNTAIEIDHDGQVNVEGTARATVGGVGGHPDFAAGAALSPRGLSVVAMASTHRGEPTLVERLARPVSTASHDVDVVVTEHGTADLRGLDRPERRAVLTRLWDRT